MADNLRDHIIAVAEVNYRLEMEAKKQHQERMKDVCHSIKTHDNWIKYCNFPKTFSRWCSNCKYAVSPEFDMGRHRGLCLRDNLPPYEDESEYDDCDWTTVEFSIKLNDDIREWLHTMQRQNP